MAWIFSSRSLSSSPFAASSGATLSSRIAHAAHEAGTLCGDDRIAGLASSLVRFPVRGATAIAPDSHTTSSSSFQAIVKAAIGGLSSYYLKSMRRRERAISWRLRRALRALPHDPAPSFTGGKWRVRSRTGQAEGVAQLHCAVRLRSRRTPRSTDAPHPELTNAPPPDCLARSVSMTASSCACSARRDAESRRSSTSSEAFSRPPREPFRSTGRSSRSRTAAASSSSRSVACFRVMSARPGRIRRIVDIDIPHPRDFSSRLRSA